MYEDRKPAAQVSHSAGAVVDELNEIRGGEYFSSLGSCLQDFDGDAKCPRYDGRIANGGTNGEANACHTYAESVCYQIDILDYTSDTCTIGTSNVLDGRLRPGYQDDFIRKDFKTHFCFCFR
ncbi:hypothetical protein MPER_09149 [Moniliophthora perniciosa FA553]|nr:hypothetical protein MPER_09149 [Moniliophthora perniciosa FA553]